jgi:sulfur carrier protein
LLIQLNGESREVLEGAVLSDLVHELSLAPARIAIEVNQLVVRRDQWERTALAEGDRIEIVHFVGGGAEKDEQSAVLNEDAMPELRVPEGSNIYGIKSPVRLEAPEERNTWAGEVPYAPLELKRSPET